ncbi:MAG: hypothetical protein IT239_07230 [Bacteroidia bacterium]|nr:hypothetical protein [Bacteroidia bacterium]
MIKKIAVQYGKFKLNEERKKLLRKKNSLQFSISKNIALVFEATNEAELDKIKEFIKWLRDQKKTVKSVGFFNEKQVPPLQYSKLEYDFISHKELNWWKKPTDDFIKTFMSEDTDILINLSIKELFPLTYIAALSSAKFKIGTLTDNNINDYDLLIDISQKSTIDFLIHQLKHYLTHINQPKNANQI